MAIAITLTLPEGIIEHVKRFGWATHRNVEAVLAEALEMMWPTLGSLPEANLHPPVSNLSDAEVLALADAKMAPIQNQRLARFRLREKPAG